MKPKTLTAVALLILVFGSATFLIAWEPRQGPEVDPEKSLLQPSHRSIAYYFHGRARCSSCRKIEAYTREAILSGFAEALRDGRLEWHAVNVEEHGNEHFIKDFGLYTKSVVIVDIRDGEQIRWKNLKKVWELLYDKDAFLKYIRDEVGSYLAEN